MVTPHGFIKGSRVALDLWLALLIITLPGCGSPLSSPVTPTFSVEVVVAVNATPTPTASPQPTSTYDPPDLLLTKIASYGVDIPHQKELSRPREESLLSALHALGAKAIDIYMIAKDVRKEEPTAFRDLFGPVTIYIYPGKSTIDGINAAINCGWEGRGARGCSVPEIFPEQMFPTHSWLILVAGDVITNQNTEFGSSLIAHELVHNLTWGGGHMPNNKVGYSFVRYVGDEFAIRHFGWFGIQLGSGSYANEASRASHPRWRAELTADAVVSWAFNKITGPYSASISAFIRDSLVCILTDAPDC